MYYLYPKCDAACVQVFNQGPHCLDQGTSESVLKILHIMYQRRTSKCAVSNDWGIKPSILALTVLSQICNAAHWHKLYLCPAERLHIWKHTSANQMVLQHKCNKGLFVLQDSPEPPLEHNSWWSPSTRQFAERLAVRHISYTGVGIWKYEWGGLVSAAPSVWLTTGLWPGPAHTMLTPCWMHFLSCQLYSLFLQCKRSIFIHWLIWWNDCVCACCHESASVCCSLGTLQWKTVCGIDSALAAANVIHPHCCTVFQSSDWVTGAWLLVWFANHWNGDFFQFIFLFLNVLFFLFPSSVLQGGHCL